MTAHTPLILGSTSKSFTALAIMQLVEAGKINLDAPVQHYLPWFHVGAPLVPAASTITFRGPQQGDWLRWAEREHDNARAALASALEREEADVAVRLAAALAWPWLVHQRWSEGLDCQPARPADRWPSPPGRCRSRS